MYTFFYKTHTTTSATRWTRGNRETAATDGQDVGGGAGRSAALTSIHRLTPQSTSSFAMCCPPCYTRHGQPSNEGKAVPVAQHRQPKRRHCSQRGMQSFDKPNALSSQHFVPLCQMKAKSSSQSSISPMVNTALVTCPQASQVWSPDKKAPHFGILQRHGPKVPSRHVG